MRRAFIQVNKSNFVGRYESNFKINLFSLLLLRSSHSGMFSKNNFSHRQLSRCICQYHCSEHGFKFFEKYLWWRATFSKFACYTLLLFNHWYRRATVHHIILQNKYLLLWSTSRKATSMFWKARGNFKETSEIVKQIPVSILLETTKRHLIFWRSKETKS